MEENKKQKGFGCFKYFTIFFFFIFTSTLAFAGGFVVQRQMSLPEEIDTSGSCEYNNAIYPNGSDFKSTDGCNTCSCRDGGVSCTEKLCDVDTVDADVYLKSQFPIIQVSGEQYLSDSEFEEVNNMIIDPAVDFYKDEDFDPVLVKLNIPENESNRIRLDVSFIDGTTKTQTLSDREDGIQWWNPSCAGGCSFSDEFREKYPEIVN